MSRASPTRPAETPLFEPLEPRLLLSGEHLAYSEIVRDNSQGVEGLQGASAVAASPDGRHVYAVGQSGDAVVVFCGGGADGTLLYVETVLDGVGGVDGLDYVTAVTVSPDGMNVYTAAYNDDAVAVFRRNPTTGKLTFQQVLKNARGGVSGLDGASGVAVSADGKNVYALGYDSNGIVAFTRDTTTGDLTFQQAIVNGVGGLSGLEGPISITVSPDGKSVYAAGTVSDMLLAFDRGAATGQLTLRQTFTDGVAGADGLFGAVSVAVSPDNKYVYAAAKDEDALSLFSRNLTTGQLSFVRVVRDHTGGIDGLDQVFSLAVSPDGKALYAVADADNAVTVFARNAATGELTFLQKFKERVDSVQGLDGAEGVAVNPDGAFVYTAATRDSAVAVFKRDATTSLLIFRQVLANGDGAPIAALNSANGVAVSPDGANVYAVGSGQHPFTPGAGVPGLAVFTRDPSTGRLLFQEAIINNTGGGTDWGMPPASPSAPTGRMSMRVARAWLSLPEMPTPASWFSNRPSRTAWAGSPVLQESRTLLSAPTGCMFIPPAQGWVCLTATWIRACWPWSRCYPTRSGATAR